MNHLKSCPFEKILNKWFLHAVLILLSIGKKSLNENRKLWILQFRVFLQNMYWVYFLFLCPSILFLTWHLWQNYKDDSEPFLESTVDYQHKKKCLSRYYSSSESKKTEKLWIRWAAVNWHSPVAWAGGLSCS